MSRSSSCSESPAAASSLVRSSHSAVSAGAGASLASPAAVIGQPLSTSDSSCCCSASRPSISSPKPVLARLRLWNESVRQSALRSSVTRLISSSPSELSLLKGARVSSSLPVTSDRESSSSASWLSPLSAARPEPVTTVPARMSRFSLVQAASLPSPVSVTRVSARSRSSRSVSPAIAASPASPVAVSARLSSTSAGKRDRLASAVSVTAVPLRSRD